MFSFNIVPYTIRPPLGARKPSQTGNLQRHFHAIRPDKNKKILPPERKAGIFFQYQARRPSGRLVTATGGSCGPRHLGQHGAGLLAGAGVDVVVAEENLRRCCARSAVLSHVIGTDVDCIGGGFLDHLDGRGLRVGAGNAIGLTFGGLDDQEDAAIVGEGLVQLEGKGFTLAHDGGGGRVLNSHLPVHHRFQVLSHNLIGLLPACQVPLRGLHGLHINMNTFCPDQCPG